MSKLSGKVVVVAGASRRFGAGMAGVITAARATVFMNEKSNIQVHGALLKAHP